MNNKKLIILLFLFSIILFYVFALFPLPFVQFSDGVNVWVPRLSYSINTLQNLIIPFWNPYQFCGTTLLADGNTNIINPVTLFYFFLSPPWAYTAGIFALFITAVLSTWNYFRIKGFSINGSMIGTISYVFSGQILFWSLYHGMNLSLSFFPLILYFFIKFKQNKKGKYSFNP